MSSYRLLLFAIPVLALGACGEEHSPTAPGQGPAGSVQSFAAGHKVVNSLADPGDGICNAAQCTLREAINDPQSTEITFAPGLTGPITLAVVADGGGRLEIGKPLTITGPSSRMAIRGRNPDEAFPVLAVGHGATVTLSNLILRRGARGILNRGTLTVNNCQIVGNGEGIFSTETLTLTNSLISGNAGNGVSVRGLGQATLRRDRIAANSGRGLVVGSASAELINSTVAGNAGGGILNNTATLTIKRSTIANNSTTGEGGGILNISDDVFRRVNARVTLVNSTVSGNSAGAGGGIANSPDRSVAVVSLTNSTVTGNSASQQGGGIFQSCCDPNNDEDNGAIGLTNSIVAQNSAPAGPDALLLQGFKNSSFSLIGDGTGSGIPNGADGNMVGTAASPIAARLGTLADNGGFTHTHALMAGSPAIDAGSAAECPSTDQRGMARPQGAGCDMGSYERE
jgi:CSLREA domain-containing protein